MVVPKRLTSRRVYHKTCIMAITFQVECISRNTQQCETISFASARFPVCRQKNILTEAFPFESYLRNRNLLSQFQYLPVNSRSRRRANQFLTIHLVGVYYVALRHPVGRRPICRRLFGQQPPHCHHLLSHLAKASILVRIHCHHSRCREKCC